MRHLNLPVLATLLAALLAPAAAQTPEDTPPTAGPTAEAAVEDLEALQKRLSTWRLRVATDATWSDAEKELEVLLAAAEAAALAAPRDEGRRALLADLHARAILWTARRGDVQATSDRIVGLRLVANERSAFPRRTVVLAANATLERADVREVEESIPEGARRASLPSAVSHAEDVVIARAVQEAVKRNDTEFLGKLGAKAIPALVDLTYVMDGSPIPAGEADPLQWVFSIDRPAGYDVALELLRRDEYLLQRAVLDRLAKGKAFTGEAAWVPEGETDWRLRKPEWIEILDRLVPTSGPAGPEVRGMIVAFAEHGALPTALQPRCEAALTNVSRTTGSYRSHVFSEAGHDFFAGLLDSPHARVREWAAKALSRSKSPEVLLSLATHPDVELRKLLAGWLLELPRREWVDAARTRHDNVPATFEIDRAYVEATRTLLLDPDATVRQNAATSLKRLSFGRAEATLDAGTVRDLLSDAKTFSSEWNAASAIVQVLPEADRLPTVLHAIGVVAEAARADESVTGQLAGFLDTRDYGLAPADSYWSIVAEIERTSEPADWFQKQIATVAGSWIERDLLEVGGLLDWLEAHPTKPVLTKAFEAPLLQQQPGFDGHWPSGASSPERARILILAADLQSTWDGSGSVVRKLRHKQVALDAADVVALIDDESAPRAVREWALDPLVETYPEQLTQSRIETMARLMGADASRRSVESLRYAPSVPDLKERLIVAMLRDPNIAPRRIAAQRFSAERQETVDLVLERFPPETWSEFGSSELIKSLVTHIARTTSDTLDPRLAYANVRNTELQRTLAWVLGDIRSKAQFPLLAEVLRTSSAGDRTFQTALNSVTGFLDDEAAALLIDTARTMSNEATRQLIMASLDQILAWQDAAERWERGRDAAARRMDAIDDLIGIAEDEKQPALVRAEALRGLGLLGAAEELPRLVRALTDADETIRTAAREAIERLHSREANAGDDE